MLHTAALVERLCERVGARVVTADGTGNGDTAVVLGIVLFSGSLYALALSGVRALGAVTPFGGGLLIGGWVALAVAARGPRATND